MSENFKVVCLFKKVHTFKAPQSLQLYSQNSVYYDPCEHSPRTYNPFLWKSRE